MNEQSIPPHEDEDEIDLMALAKTMWNGRKTILISIIIGTVLGLFVAILTPKEYTATSIMVPQTGSRETSLGGLGGLAALAGIDLSSSAGSSELSPIIYPKIVNSIPFKLEMMNTPIKFDKIQKPITLYDYYTNPEYNKATVLGTISKYTIGLPGVILNALKGIAKDTMATDDASKQLLVLTEDQYEVIKKLKKIISLEVVPKEGFLTLTVTMPEALVAAQLAQKAQDLLQREITNFKVEKAKAELEFIQGLYDEAKAIAEGYQIDIAQNTDRYKNLTSALPQVQTTRIQTKYGIANTVFAELAKQLEQAKIQVKKDTPIFTIVEPVSVPIEKSKPNRPLLLFIWIFLGGIVGVSIVFGKGLMANVKHKWNETN